MDGPLAFSFLKLNYSFPLKYKLSKTTFISIKAAAISKAFANGVAVFDLSRLACLTIQSFPDWKCLNQCTVFLFRIYAIDQRCPIKLFHIRHLCGKRVLTVATVQRNMLKGCHLAFVETAWLQEKTSFWHI